LNGSRLRLMKPQKVLKPVTPAKAGVQVSEHARLRKHLMVDSRVCGNDEKMRILIFYEFIKHR
jgi:hypothetical protein